MSFALEVPVTGAGVTAGVRCHSALHRHSKGVRYRSASSEIGDSTQSAT